MPTELKDFDLGQDAITIFADCVNDETTISHYLENFYEEGQYTYLKEYLGGKDLFEWIEEKINNAELLHTTNNRMVIGYYAELQTLTEDWIASFFLKAAELTRFVPLNYAFDQHYVLCFRYRAGYITDQDEQQRLNRLLVRLTIEHPEISHQVYLLRVAGLGADFMSQEKAIVNLLHMLSRKDYRFASTPGVGQNYLRMIDCIDYYTARAQNCRARIEEVDDWQKKAVDSGLVALQDQIRIRIHSATAELGNAVRGFRRRAQIYPVNIEQFKGNCITGYHAEISQNNPLLLEIREEYIREYRDAIISNTDFEELGGLISRYHYPDYMELKQLLEGDLKESILNQNEHKDDSVEKLCSALCEKVKTAIIKNMPEDLEEIREKKMALRKTSIKEQYLAGRFKDIDDCFLRINDEASPKVIEGVIPEILQTIALVSGDPASQWNTMAYTVDGISQVYRYSAIDPCEIVLLKETSLVDLGNDDAENKLRIIY